MKRKLFFIAVIVICLSLTAYGTLAYFTAEDTAHNVITTGDVRIQLVEKTASEDGTLVEFPKEGLSGIMPGTDASKIVSVKNTGSAKAWIRIQVETSVTGADGEPLPTSVSKGSSTVPVMSFQIGDKWVKNGDWYYYTEPVDANASTSTLFETVHFAAEMDNSYVGCTAQLTITAKAIQHANNGETYDKAYWPDSTT